jgi:hypothetical protein
MRVAAEFFATIHCSKRYLISLFISSSVSAFYSSTNANYVAV